MFQDLRLATRLLKKSPLFTTAALGCLALGVGMSATIFTLFDALVLHPHAFDTDGLVSVTPSFRARQSAGFVSGPEYEAIRSGASSLESVATYDVGNRNLTGVDTPERLVIAIVTPNLFDTYGVAPVIGRDFLPEETRPGASADVIIVSHRLWQNRFGSDPKLVGGTIQINGMAHKVAGVLPPRFLLGRSGLGGADLYAPFTRDFERMPRSSRELPVVARLKPGATVEAAQSELQVIASRLERDHVSEAAEYKGWHLNATPLAQSSDPSTRTGLTVLFAAVSVVLLIACVNVANLILARAAGRQREVAIRSALGASRWRLVRQFLAESVALSVAGGLLGILLTYWGVDLLLNLLPRNVEVLPPGTEVAVNLRVLAFAAGLSALATIVFGLAPAFGRATSRMAAGLQEGGSRSAGGLGARRMTSALVVTEVALSLVLVAGTALVVRSYEKVLAVKPGFEPQNVLVMRSTLPRNKYQGAAVAQFFEQAENRIASLPGVSAVGVANQMPPIGFTAARFQAENDPTRTEPPSADLTIASPGFLRAMRIPLLRGRFLEASDAVASAPSAVVNEKFAALLFPGQDAIGKRIRTGVKSPWLTIVGIIANTRNRGLDLPSEPEVFVHVAKDGGTWNQLWLIVRTEREPTEALNAIRQEIKTIDPDQPVYLAMALNDVIGFRLLQRRAAAWLLTVFGIAALLLAAVGLYGVVAYSVSRRTQEIGVRVALGATRGDVLRLVLVQGMRLGGLGVLIGGGAAALSTRFASRLLYEVSPYDPLAFAASAAILLGTTLLASYIPARRAAKVEPLNALRYE